MGKFGTFHHSHSSTLQNISEYQWSSSHTSPLYIWYLTVSTLLSLIEPKRALTASCFPPLCVSRRSASPLFLILHLISSNYLIISDFVTHTASRLLLLVPMSIFSTHPSYFLYLHLGVPSLKVTVQLLILKGHQGPLWGWWQGEGLFCPLQVSCITGKQILIIPPRKKGLCWGEKGHYLVPSCAVLGVCVCPGRVELV